MSKLDFQSKGNKRTDNALLGVINNKGALKAQEMGPEVAQVFSEESAFDHFQSLLQNDAFYPAAHNREIYQIQGGLL